MKERSVPNAERLVEDIKDVAATFLIAGVDTASLFPVHLCYGRLNPTFADSRNLGELYSPHGAAPRVL